MPQVSPRTVFFVNSALAFASAELLTAALHESGHGVVAQLLGFAPRIYGFYEDNPAGTPTQTVAILAAGPLVSLLLGALFWLWYRRAKPHYTFARLLLLWMALLGVMEFVNYLIVTPWLRGGDTAQLADIFGFSMVARYGVTAIGILLLVALARPAANAFVAAAPRSTVLDSSADRRRYIIFGFYLPLLAGVALTAIAGIGTVPVYVLYGLLGTIGNIDIVAASLYARGRPPTAGDRAPDAPLRIEPVAIVIYAALVLVYVLAFSRGVPV